MKTNSKFTKVIVVDAKTHMPMSWCEKQFCFVNPIELTSKRVNGLKVKTFTRQDAIILIKADYQFRKENNLSEHKLMLCLAEHGKC